MRRPEWLHWQPIRLSAWLWVFLYISALPPIGYLLVVTRRPLSPFSGIGLSRLAREFYSLPRLPVVIVYSVASQLLLIWFTYFSGSPRVREHDKFSVFMMTAAYVSAWVLIVSDGSNGAITRLLPN